MPSRRSSIYNSPIQEAKVTRPLRSAKISSYEESDIEDREAGNLHVRQAQKRPRASHDNATPADCAESIEDEDTTIVNEQASCGPYITLKYCPVRTPTGGANPHGSAHQASTARKRRRAATRQPSRVARRRNSLSASDHKVFDEAAAEKIKHLETENRKLLYANDQHKLNVTALQNQIQGLQQRKARLEQEKQQLKDQIVASSPATENKPSAAYLSFTPSQQAALTSLEIHRNLLPSQPSTLPSPELSTTSSKSNTEVVDVKIQLASKKEEIKKLRKQNERLEIELARLQYDIKKIFHNNEELTKSVMRFARLEQVEWPRERMQMSTELVTLRGRVHWLEREVARLNDVAHGVLEAGEVMRLWPGHGHPQQVPLWQPQLYEGSGENVSETGIVTEPEFEDHDGETRPYDKSEMYFDPRMPAQSLVNHTALQYGADLGVTGLISTPERQLSFSDSESLLEVDLG